MKRTFLKMITILLVSTVGVCIMSCGDKEEENSSTASIVGKWEMDDDELIWCFNTDGSGYGEEFVYRNGAKVTTDIWPIKYVFDNTRNILIITDLPEDGDDYGEYTYTYDVVALTQKNLVLRRQGGNKLESFTRQ